MTIMMMGEGTFTIDDWNDLTNELKQSHEYVLCAHYVNPSYSSSSSLFASIFSEI